jgi:hypothetical protein
VETEENIFGSGTLFFLLFLLDDGRIRFRIRTGTIMTDPGGPKTYGSHESGSTTQYPRNLHINTAFFFKMVSGQLFDANRIRLPILMRIPDFIQKNLSCSSGLLLGHWTVSQDMTL